MKITGRNRWGITTGRSSCSRSTPRPLFTSTLDISLVLTELSFVSIFTMSIISTSLLWFRPPTSSSIASILPMLIRRVLTYLFTTFTRLKTSEVLELTDWENSFRSKGLLPRLPRLDLSWSKAIFSAEFATRLSRERSSSLSSLSQRAVWTRSVKIRVSFSWSNREVFSRTGKRLSFRRAVRIFLQELSQEPLISSSEESRLRRPSQETEFWSQELLLLSQMCFPC